MKKRLFSALALAICFIALILLLAPDNPSPPSSSGNPPLQPPYPQGSEKPTTGSTSIDSAKNLGTAKAVDDYAKPVVETFLSKLDSRVVSQSSETLPSLSRQISIIETSSDHRWLRVERNFDPAGKNQHTAVAMQADRFLVQLADNAYLDELEYLSTELGFAHVSPIGHSGLAQVSLASFAEPRDLPNAIRSIRAFDQIIAFAEPDYLLFQADIVPNDPEFDRQWSLGNTLPQGTVRQNDIDAPQGWEIATDAANTIVAVIDTGLRLTHEDIRENLWSNTSEILDGIDNDENGYIDDIHGINAITDDVNLTDDNGHGTAMSGAIAAQGNNAKGIAGVAWKAQIMPLKFIPEEGGGTTSDAIKCILYAIDQGADIINASWGGPGDSRSLHTALRQANDAGIIILTAAGNEALNIDVIPSYPAAYSDIPNLITVAATMRDGQLAYFSNYGITSVDIAAPGDSIISLSNLADDAYDYSSGTSISTAIASGVAALLHATYGPDDLPTRLSSTVTLKPHLRAYASSAGIINLYRALAEQTNSPVNDDFANATPLENTLNVTSAHLSYATTQATEPNPSNYPAARTLWYRLPAALDSFGIEVSSPNGEVTLAVYQGNTLESLELQSSQAISGQTTISVDGLDSQTPHFLQASGPESSGAFTFRLFQQPANDDLANAIELSGNAFETTANNRYATSESKETPLSPKALGKSLWWTIEASQSGTFALSTLGSQTDTIIGIFANDSSQTPTLLATNDNYSTATFLSRATATLEAGRRYTFCVDSVAGLGGPITLQGQYLSQPEITAPIKNQFASIGASVEFRVEAVGPPPLSYEWIKDGVTISGESNSRLKIAYTTVADFGTYQVRVHSPESFVTSEPFKLLEGSDAPEIQRQPDFTVFRVGETGKLSVRAKGSAPLQYQWYKNGEPIDGENEQDLLFQNAETSDAGLYRVIVSSPLGQFESALVSVTIVPADEIDLTIRSKLGNHGFVRSLAYFKNQWIAAGMFGKVTVSTDGYNWSEPAYQFEETNVAQLIAGTDHLLARLEDGRIGSTTDGATWTVSELGSSSEGTLKVVSLNGIFAALTLEGKLYISTNGQNWTQRFVFPASTQGTLSLAAANGAFLAAKSTDDEITFARSTNGTSWSTHTATDLGHFNYSGPTPAGLYSAEDTFLLTTGSGSWKSSNGIDWTKINLQRAPTDCTKVGDYYYYVYDLDELARTQDFEQSEVVFRNTATPFGISELAYAHSSAGWLVGPYQGLLLLIQDIQEIEIPGYPDPVLGSQAWEGITFAAGEFIAWRDTEVATSPTGSRWQSQYLAPDGGNFSGINGLLYANQSYHIGNAMGPSLDSLKLVENNIKPRIWAFGEGLYVATKGSAIYTSSNGIAWEIVDSEVREQINKLIFAGGKFVAVGREGYIATSDDGRVWTEQKLSTTNALFDIAFDGDRYLATIADGTITTSPDAIVWLPLTLDLGVTNTLPKNIAYGNGQYVLIDAQYAYLSTDLVNWKHSRHDFGGVNEIAYGNGAFIGVSSNGTIVQIGKISTLPPTIEIENGAEIFARLGETVSLDIVIAQFDSDITDLSLYVDGVLLASGIESLDSVDWTSNAIGDHRLGLVVTDSNGNQAQTGIRARVNKPLNLQILNDLPSLGYRNIIKYRGAFFAIGNNNVVFRSSNLLDWDPIFIADRSVPLRFVPTPQSLAMVCEDGLFVSKDLIHWIFHSPEQITSYNSVVPVGEYLFDTSGPTSELRYSKNGKRWTTLPFEYTSQIASFRSILATTPQGVAFRSVNDGEFFTWDEATGWKNHTIDPTQSIRQMLQLGDKTIALLQSIEAPDTFHAWESTDLDNWHEASPLPGFDPNHDLNERDGIFYYSARTSGSFVSLDGMNTWTNIDSSSFFHDSIKRNDEIFLLSYDKILHSPDGENWQSIPIENLPSGKFETTGVGLAILGSNGSIHFYLDGDGIQTVVDGEFASDAYIYSIAYGHAGYVATRDQSILLSQDAVNWQAAPKPVGSDYAIAYGNNVYVLAGDFNSVFRSTDGKSWQETATPQDSDRIAFLPAAGLFISENGSRNYMTSPDGIEWTQRQQADTWHSYLNVAGDQAYLEIDAVYSTTDGINWTAQPLLANPQLVYYQNGIYLALDKAAEALRSNDGINWEKLPLPNEAQVTAIRPTNKGFMVMSQKNNYITSDGSTWTEIGDQSPRNDPHYLNTNIWYSGAGISELSDQDLELSEVLVQAGEYAVGDLVSLSLTISNQSGHPINLHGLEIRSCLTTDGQWSDSEASLLESIYLPEKLLAAGERWTYTIDIQLANQTNYGDYSLLCWLNPSQVVPENIITNNFRETTSRALSLPKRSVTIAPTTGGTAIIAPGGRLHSKGTQLTIIPQAAPGYVFDAWTGLNTTSRELSFTLNEDTVLSPNFTKVYTPRITTSGQGTVLVDPDKGVFQIDDRVTLDAAPASGWVFDQWTGGAQGRDSEIELLIQDDISIHASFSQTYDSFREVTFTLEDLAIPSISAAEADPDRDGASNLLEFAMGSNPRDPNSKPRIEYIVTKNEIRMRFDRIQFTKELAVEARWSSDLQSWSAEGIATKVVSTDPTGTQTVEAVIPMTHQTTFIRISATSTPAQ